MRCNVESGKALKEMYCRRQSTKRKQRALPASFMLLNCLAESDLQGIGSVRIALSLSK